MSQMEKEGFGEEFSICSSFCFGGIRGGLFFYSIPKISFRKFLYISSSFAIKLAKSVFVSVESSQSQHFFNISFPLSLTSSSTMLVTKLSNSDSLNSLPCFSQYFFSSCLSYK